MGLLFYASSWQTEKGWDDMVSKKEAAEKIWQQLNEKMTPGQRRSLQKLNDAFDAYKGDLNRGHDFDLKASLVLAAMDGVLGFVPVKAMTKTNTVLGFGKTGNGQYWYVLCTSPEEAALCPEEILTCMKLETIVVKAIQNKDFAGLWLNPYGGHKCSISREDLALYSAMAEFGVLDNSFHESVCDTGSAETEVGKPKRFGDGRYAGSACVMVYEQGIGNSQHPFWTWLREEGFHSWGVHGNYGMNWVFINLNSMEYAPGMPGIRLASPIREHAITMEEFKTIWQIYRKYDGLGPLVMPEQ